LHSIWLLRIFCLRWIWWWYPRWRLNWRLKWCFSDSSTVGRNLWKVSLKLIDHPSSFQRAVREFVKNLSQICPFRACLIIFSTRVCGIKKVTARRLRRLDSRKES
jgi:hypothetical protein